MILAIVDDLLFRSKLEATAAHLGAPLTVARDAAPALRPGSQWSRVIIDLDLSSGDPLEIIRALRTAHPQVDVIGYYSHVRHDLAQQAREAGCADTLPRSVFVQQLPELLRSHTTP